MMTNCRDKRVIVFGEILFDVFDDKDVIGGAAYNFCHWFARLGCRAWLCSALGNDRLGEIALEKLSASKIEKELMSIVNKPTGRCTVSMDENGKPTYNLQQDVAYDSIDAQVQNINDIGASAFCFGTLIQRDDRNVKTLKSILENCHFDEILCDVNVREGAYSDSAMKLCLEWATILKFSDDEEKYVQAVVGTDTFEGIAQKFKNVKLILRTMGAKGAQIYDVCAKRTYAFESKRVEVKSTVGCGDSYCAAFLHRYLLGESVTQCAQAAKELSAYVATIQGAVE